MVMNASVCLFGPWTLALKGATSQFAMGWRLAEALSVSESVEAVSVKIEKRDLLSLAGGSSTQNGEVGRGWRLLHSMLWNS